MGDDASLGRKAESAVAQGAATSKKVSLFSLGDDETPDNGRDFHDHQRGDDKRGIRAALQQRGGRIPTSTTTSRGPTTQTQYTTVPLLPLLLLQLRFSAQPQSPDQHRRRPEPLPC